MLSNMDRKYGSRAMQEQLPNNALITSKPVSQKHYRLDQRYPSSRASLELITQAQVKAIKVAGDVILCLVIGFDYNVFMWPVINTNIGL